MDIKEQIVREYIEAYNNFDIDGMLINLGPLVKFENIAGGKVNMTLLGLPEFKAQAEQAKNLFSTRKQTITALHYNAQQVEVDIDYYGVLAVDLPNGMKKGDELNLTGKSVFVFEGETITAITDIS
ncbi:nuclear transport factor 2 family protein [Inquilinus sp. KBS0705]|nr:nuclear transport factor 2 family protein [Inquilinus sp. KBS0705]